MLFRSVAERTARAVTTEADVTGTETTPLRTIAEEAKTAVLAERVKEADSEEGVKAVLMSFLKVRDMAEVYKAVTGYEYGGRFVGVKKEAIATDMSGQIMAMRENGDFRMKSLEEKYEELKKLRGMPLKLSLCTLSELEELARKLEIEVGTYEFDYEKKSELKTQITEKLKERKLEGLRRAGSQEEARRMLKECDTKILGELARMVGSEFSERIAEARGNHSGEELIEWAIEWVIERIGNETKMTEERVMTEETPIEAETEETPIEAETEETSIEAETEELTPAMSFPLEEHTAESLKNLVYTIYSRGSLMSKATGGDFRVSDSVVEELKEYGSTKEEVLQIIMSAAEEGIHGLSFEEDKVLFTGFPATEDEIKSRANIVLAEAINKNCLEHKRIQAKKADESNEKFSFRVWLVRLGLNGSDVKAERNTFYANLTGHTAFRTKEYAEKWYERRKTLKAEE